MNNEKLNIKIKKSKLKKTYKFSDIPYQHKRSSSVTSNKQGNEVQIAHALLPVLKKKWSDEILNGVCKSMLSNLDQKKFSQ